MTALEIQKDGRYLLKGELKFDNVVGLLQQGLAIIKAQEESVFDLSAVTYTNSAGLALLMAWFRTAKRLNKRLNFTALPAQLLTLIKVTDLQTILPLR